MSLYNLSMKQISWVFRKKNLHVIHKTIQCQILQEFTHKNINPYAVVMYSKQARPISTPQQHNNVSMETYRIILELRKRSALAVNCCVIIHCLEVSCKEDQITSAAARDLSLYN